MRGEAGSANTDDAAVVWASKIENGLLTEADADALDDWLTSEPHRLAALARAQVANGAGRARQEVTQRNLAVSRRRFLSMTIVAGIGAAVLGENLLRRPHRHHYATDVGEMGHVLLPDGSMAILNTATEISLKFTRAERSVRLVRGEALFDVEQDARRLFSVEARDVVLRTRGVPNPGSVREGHARLGALIDYGRDIALPLTQAPSRAGFEARGTTFSTRIRLGDRVEVAVLEGMIQVGGLPLKTGETLSAFRGHFEMRPVGPKALENKLAWLERQMVLGPGDTVSDGVSELNRYNAMRVVVDGPIATRQLRGKFRVDRPMDFVHVLEQLTGARVLFGDRVVTIAD